MAEDGLVVFPKRATILEIDDYAFRKCTSLRKVIVCSVSTKLGKGVFYDCKSLISAKLPEGLQVIEQYLFQYCGSLTTVEIPSSVIKISECAFSGCESLAAFGLPQGLLEIGDFAFEHCASIETLHIPSSVSSIGHSAFEYCIGLRNVKLPPNFETIEPNVFNGCERLEFIDIPSTLKTIEDCAFDGCTSLSHLRIPPSVESIAPDAFSGCSSLISIELPEGILSDIHLSDCLSLVNMAIPVPIDAEFGFLEDALPDSKLGSVADDEADIICKLKHRFGDSSLNKLCYYQSYYSSEDAMLQLHDLMEDNPLSASSEVDVFGMTPLHVLSLSQIPNLDMLLAVMKAGQPDHIIHGRDSFGSTPMDYLCLNRTPRSTEVIRGVLQTRFDHCLGLDRSWKSDMLLAVEEALAVDWSSRKREVVAIYFKFAKLERQEVLSLLELFLWKVKIFGSKKEPITNRQSCRINSGASVVIPHVLPFLDNIDVENYSFSSP
eukprot:scaffold2143_cov125-Cylindrotheca_fusiformis.AAC.23